MKKPHFFWVAVLVFFSACQSPEANLVSQAKKAGTIDRHAILRINYQISWTEGVKRIEFSPMILQSIIGRQIVASAKISPTPDRQWNNRGTEYFEFIIPNADKIGEAKIFVDYDIYLLKHAMFGAETRKDLDPTIYLNPDSQSESNDPEIVAIASSLKATSQEDTIKNIYSFVRGHIPKIVHGTTYSAKEVLIKGEGDCSEYVALTKALLRASGIPAKMETGFLLDTTVQHGWIEAFTDTSQWKIIDTTRLYAEIENGSTHYVYTSENYWDAFPRQVTSHSLFACHYDVELETASVEVSADAEVMRLF